MQVLKGFEDLSGLIVNFDKSKAMVSRMVPRQKCLKLAAMSSISFAGNLGKYLGLPLLQGRVKNSGFNFLIDKLKSRLSGWKGKLLNKPGRITLAKAILTSMLVYNMQFVWLPNGICDDIDRIIHNFIRHKGETRRMNWNTIASPKGVSGLGVRQARLTNVAMLGKLVSEFTRSSPKL